VEFVVQFLVLGHAHRHPGLTGNIGNLALLKLAASLDLLPDELAVAGHSAYREFRRLQHAMRLQGERYARVDPGAVAHHALAVQKIWQWIFVGAGQTRD